MNEVKLLDCTLREAPLKGLVYGTKFLYKFIGGLEKAKINFLEVGFLIDGIYESGSTAFTDVKQIERYLINKKKDIIYVALIDVGRFNVDCLPENNGRSIDGIRICFKKGEQKEALKYANKIKKKGYLAFIQHVDTLGYTDDEIKEFVELVNEVNPYAYSIVDTFGSMYQDDIRHLYKIVNENLNTNIRIGFHSHNNLMLANSNSQEFIRLAVNDKRQALIDASVLGCGRGAGNAHTELMMEYLNKKYFLQYEVNEILDLIDVCMPAISQKCIWGYSIPYFISGLHNAHVFNVNQLLKRHNIKSRDLRAIIESLSEEQKKKYNYSLLEKLYVEHFNNEVDDKKTIDKLKKELKGRKVLLLAPGKSLQNDKLTIEKYILNESPIIIGVNNVIDDFKTNYIFFSGIKRYEEVERHIAMQGKFIITSNIKQVEDEDECIVNYLSLIEYGWVNIDNSVILLLRLLLLLDVNSINIAGLDGYILSGKDNFYKDELSNQVLDYEDIQLLNREMKEMLMGIKLECKRRNISFEFITNSLYEFSREVSDV